MNHDEVQAEYVRAQAKAVGMPPAMAEAFIAQGRDSGPSAAQFLGDEIQATYDEARAEMASPPSVLAEADKIINGVRQRDYGHPLDAYTVLANLVAALPAIPPTAEGMCVWFTLGKIARYAASGYTWHRDTVMDIAGYAGLLEMIRDERERREGTAHCYECGHIHRTAETCDTARYRRLDEAFGSGMPSPAEETPCRERGHGACYWRDGIQVHMPAAEEVAP